ncbi:MAG: efflux RND transporter permease subunit [Pseudomonadota bacterium]
MKLLEKLLANHPFANITFAVVLVLGAYAYVSLPREQDPEINFNWVNITTTLPGASAQDVEKKVTEPLEDAIQQVSDIRYILSSSRENVSNILVRFGDISPRVFDKRVNDLRREIQNKATDELPEEAVDDPRVDEITTSNGFPTAMVLVVGRADDEPLRDTARRVKTDLERIAGVDTVFASGLHDPELRVEFEPHRLAARGLTGADVADAVSGWFRDTFAGRARAGDAEWLVRVLGTDSDPEYLARLTVSPAANPQTKIPLDAVATTVRARATPEQLVRHEGRPAVLMAVNKKSYTNTLQLVERINGYIGEKNRLLAPAGVQLRLLDDQTVPTREALTIMQRNALIGLTLVLAVCWAFLGARLAVLVSLGIPFALAGTFGLLFALGFTLNISVLLGVVIALGMLVDDVVVVTEAIHYRLERGQQVAQAVLDSLREVAIPVTSAVLTTISAFLPLMLLPGIVGKFMFVIPFVVTVALLFSLTEAFWMMPTHASAMRFRSARERGHDRRWRFNHWIRVKYALALMYVMRRPRRFAAAGFLLVGCAAAAVALGWIRVQFFAFDPLRIFYVNVDMPAGAPIQATLDKLLAAEERVRRHLQPGEARALAAVAGLKFTDTEPVYGDSYGQVIVSLNPRKPGGRDAQDIVEAMRAQVLATPGPGKVSFTVLSGGPPTSKPVRVRVRGDDPAELRAAADALKAIVAAIPGTVDVADDEVAGRPELRLTLNREAVRNAGLTPALAARLTRLHVDGEIVAEMRDRGEKVEVRVRGLRPAGQDIAAVLDDPVALPGGGTTTLAALAHHETAPGEGIIRHYNLRRAITVEADLDRETTDTVTVNREIQSRWQEVAAARFPGASLDFSGELDDIQESLDAMGALFVLGIGLIYLILAAQFRSYWQPLMILVTVPLAFTGVAYGLLVSRNPLSLYTLYGVIALTGVAVNAAIVLIDAANRRLKDGMSVLHAAVYAARRRVVPIVITTTTTIAGLFSLAFGLGGKSLVWGPVAASIVWGLGFATALTLFVVPMLYWAFMRRPGQEPLHPPRARPWRRRAATGAAP